MSARPLTGPGWRCTRDATGTVRLALDFALEHDGHERAEEHSLLFQGAIGAEVLAALESARARHADRFAEQVRDQGAPAFATWEDEPEAPPRRLPRCVGWGLAFAGGAGAWAWALHAAGVL